jgi:hypothetical protein
MYTFLYLADLHAPSQQGGTALSKSLPSSLPHGIRHFKTFVTATTSLNNPKVGVAQRDKRRMVGVLKVAHLCLSRRALRFRCQYLA